MVRFYFIAALLACFVLAFLDAVPVPDGTDATTSSESTTAGDDIDIAPGDEPEQRIAFDMPCVHSVLQEFDPALDKLFSDCLTLTEAFGITDDFSCLTNAYEQWLEAKYPNADESAQNAQDDQAQSALNPDPLDKLENCFPIATTPEQSPVEIGDSTPANTPATPAPDEPTTSPLKEPAP